MTRNDGVIHEEVIVRKYRAASPWAHLFHASIYVITLVLPLVIAFLTQGLWRKVELYREQPVVDFEGKCILLIRGSADNEYVVWSSFHNLNEAIGSHLNVPLIEKQRFDWNSDGKTDKASVKTKFADIQFPVHSVLWVLLLNYKLDQRFLIEMVTSVVGETEQLRPGSGVRIAGHLNMLQRELLFEDFKQDSPFNCSSDDVTQFEPSNLLAHGLSLNYSTELTSQKVIWEPSVTAENRFTVTMDIHVAPQILHYRTGVFQLLKWAWIQYLSLFIVAHYALRNFAAFVFENRLVAVTVL
ncbi:hypothetical protein QR680_002957 [Steinernema hermaphroditum]|uniref:Transmembrane protein 231 n=1 Tax=Steinernema hermaphroditum TaxID=289476 RepID=A0AA39LJ58_9BILA|nr:hypothetical protein QR680_002957 [Steinernema hermaphroditum]